MHVDTQGPEHQKYQKHQHRQLKCDLHAVRAGTPAPSSQRGLLGTRCAATKPEKAQELNQNNTEHGAPENLPQIEGFPPTVPHLEVWTVGIENGFGKRNGRKSIQSERKKKKKKTHPKKSPLGTLGMRTKKQLSPPYGHLLISNLLHQPQCRLIMCLLCRRRLRDPATGARTRRPAGSKGH